MTESIIEQELMGNRSSTLKCNSYTLEVYEAIQKAFEELKKYGNCHKLYPHLCSKHPEDCEIYFELSDVEKCFGVGNVHNIRNEEKYLDT